MIQRLMNELGNAQQSLATSHGIRNQLEARLAALSATKDQEKHQVVAACPQSGGYACVQSGENQSIAPTSSNHDPIQSQILEALQALNARVSSIEASSPKDSLVGQSLNGAGRIDHDGNAKNNHGLGPSSSKASPFGFQLDFPGNDDPPDGFGGDGDDGDDPESIESDELKKRILWILVHCNIVDLNNSPAMPVTIELGRTVFTLSWLSLTLVVQTIFLHGLGRLSRLVNQMHVPSLQILCLDLIVGWHPNC